MSARRADVSRRGVAAGSGTPCGGASDGWSRLVSCEHGGNAIPPRYAALFAGREALLASHRGYDPGALSMAKTLARALGAPLVASTTSRLLVELNRSPGRQFRLSPIMRAAPRALRDEVTRDYYVPYRSRVEAFVEAAVAAGRSVLHVSSHSFTPALDGTIRCGDIGLLYDPARPREREFCVRWQRTLSEALPGLVVRRNFPYLGRSDGVTSCLRKRFRGDDYLGIELEVNQHHARNDALPVEMRRATARALREVLGESMRAQ
ncbi:MAG TPA: N-formylglutamate amidohydrolase [Casimicrobiaceae bacterium]